MKEFKSLEDVSVWCEHQIQKDWVVYGRTINVSNRVRFGGFERGVKRLGRCKYLKHDQKIIIYLSKQMVGLNLDKVEAIKGVILHELAHAVDFYMFKSSSHDKRWKHIAKEIGASPNRMTDTTDWEYPSTKYTLICPICGHKTPISRKLKRDYSCGNCSPNKFDLKFKMILIKNY